MEKVKLDIVSENFDKYFAKICSDLAPSQKAVIPTSLLSLIFGRAGKVLINKLWKVGFLARMYILTMVVKRRVFILVEGNDSEDAMSLHDFVNYRKNIKEKNTGEAPTLEMISHGHFVVGAKELVEGIEYLNMVSAGPVYNYLINLKNTKRDAYSEWKTQREYIIRFLLNYESHKRKWVKQFDVDMSEFLVLMYGYDGREFNGGQIYNGPVKNAYYSSGADIRRALSSLRHRGYITKTGVSVNARYRITPIGRHVVDEILDTYAYRT